MPLDDMEKKLLSMLNAPTPGERPNPLEALHAHQERIKHFCRDIVQEVENSVARQLYDAEVSYHNMTKASLSAYRFANQGLVAMLWVKGKWQRHWRDICLFVVPAAVGFFG